MGDKELKFKAKVIRNICDYENFKSYAVTVDKQQYPFIKYTKYQNAVINGDLPPLTMGIEYDVTAVEEHNKYGYSYKVRHIKMDVPTTDIDMYVFLQEILTPRQAETLWNVYPDIVQRVQENRLEDIDLNKLNGIGQITFDRIKAKIEENFCLADLVIEFQGYLTLSVIRKIYNKYTSIDVLRKKLSTDPYKCLCSISGVGFKSADSILRTMERVSKENVKNGKRPIINFDEDLSSSKQRCLACVLYLLEENESEGNTCANLADMRRQCIEMVPECSDYFVEVINNDDIYYDKNTMNIALARTYRMETNIAETILSNLNTNTNVWDFDIEKYRNIGEFSLSDEQMKTLYNVCKNNISILNGYAGSGKSFSTQALINMLEEHGKSFELFAPTGKASKVIAEFTGRKASTIHRGLCYSPAYGWTYNKYNKLLTDIVIVDEFSMCDVWLFERLIEAIDFNTTKLLLIGDSAQLPSVGCGNLLHDFMSANIIPTTTLTKIFRYNDGGLMRAATDTRCGRRYLDKSMVGKATTFGNNEDYMFVDLKSDAIPKCAIELYKKLLDNGNSVDSIQVLTAKNINECGVEELNRMLQQVANKNYGSELFMKVGETCYYKGDLVLQRANEYNAEIYRESRSDIDVNYFPEDDIVDGVEVKQPVETAFIANGDVGRIEKAYNTYVVINFDGIRVKYYREDMQKVSLGYAMTIHKSQGSGIDNVIICSPSSHTFMMNSNLLYVALTRTKKKCYHLGSLRTVNNAIGKKANLERHTFMQELLSNMN